MHSKRNSNMRNSWDLFLATKYSSWQRCPISYHCLITPAAHVDFPFTTVHVLLHRYDGCIERRGELGGNHFCGKGKCLPPMMPPQSNMSGSSFFGKWCCVCCYFLLLLLRPCLFFGKKGYWLQWRYHTQTDAKKKERRRRSQMSKTSSSSSFPDT